MRSSEKPAADHLIRGFVPPRSDEERVLMRHAEDLAASALRKGIARYSAFLSDREQNLCQAAMNRIGCGCFVFDGGYADAERKILCVEPEQTWPDRPIVCIQIKSRLAGAAALQHKDYLGSLTGLEIKREGLGDIVLPKDRPGIAYVFALRPIAELIVRELREVGRVGVTAELMEADSLRFDRPERELHSATVSSLRLDSVLAAMLRCSRGMASELIAAGRVEINHVPVDSASAAVYSQDVFTVRGKGRYQLVKLSGKSRKGRQIIEYFQY